jgi:hypothetical protein
MQVLKQQLSELGQLEKCSFVYNGEELVLEAIKQI